MSLAPRLPSRPAAAAARHRDCRSGNLEAPITCSFGAAATLSSPSPDRVKPVWSASRPGPRGSLRPRHLCPSLARRPRVRVRVRLERPLRLSRVPRWRRLRHFSQSRSRLRRSLPRRLHPRRDRSLHCRITRRATGTWAHVIRRHHRPQWLPLLLPPHCLHSAAQLQGAMPHLHRHVLTRHSLLLRLSPFPRCPRPLVFSRRQKTLRVFLLLRSRAPRRARRPLRHRMLLLLEIRMHMPGFRAAR